MRPAGQLLSAGLLLLVCPSILTSSMSSRYLFRTLMYFGKNSSRMFSYPFLSSDLPSSNMMSGAWKRMLSVSRSIVACQEASLLPNARMRDW